MGKIKRFITAVVLFVFFTFSMQLAYNSTYLIRKPVAMMTISTRTKHGPTPRPPTTKVTKKPADNPPDITITNPHNFNYISNPDSICSTREIELLICVPVSRSNFEGRHVISQTWGSFAKDPKNKAALLFFIGNGTSSEKPEIEDRIREEANKYNNILQEDYIDTYQNLSLKTVSILKWTSRFCPKASFVLKADDDMYVNMPLLVKMLREKSEQFYGKFIVGHMMAHGRPHRNTKSKWHVSRDQYAAESYPNFVSGTTYAMAAATAKILYTTSLQLPFFWLEDVYLTGLCARKANIPVLDEKAMTNGKPSPRGCTFKKQITGHSYSFPEMKRIHKELYDPSLKC